VLTDDGALPLAIPRDRHGTFAPVLIPQAEGAKFWMNVFADLQTRGCRDILIAVADGLKGFPEALEAVFPPTTLQTCVVHLLRHRLTDVGWKKRKAFAADAFRPSSRRPFSDRRGRDQTHLARHSPSHGPLVPRAPSCMATALNTRRCKMRPDCQPASHTKILTVPPSHNRRHQESADPAIRQSPSAICN